MARSDGARMTVVRLDVSPGRDADVRAVLTEIDQSLRTTAQGSIDLVVDEGVPGRLYVVYRTGPDTDVAALRARLRPMLAADEVLVPGGRVAHAAIDLVAAARRAREQASAAFSGFKVGAALETADGEIITGCNVENATYGLTVCAERVAVLKAISEGHRSFVRVAVVADTPTLTPPCGACRQILWEFCGDVEIVLANPRGQTETLKLSTIFPRAFDASFL